MRPPIEGQSYGGRVFREVDSGSGPMDRPDRAHTVTMSGTRLFKIAHFLQFSLTARLPGGVRGGSARLDYFFALTGTERGSRMPGDTLNYQPLP